MLQAAVLGAVSLRTAELSRSTPAAELEAPNHATADEVVMLAGLASVGQRQIGSARPEVADIEPKTETSEAVLKRIHVQSKSALQHARSRGAAGVCPALDNGFILAEVPETAADAYPGRNGRRGKQVHAHRGSNEYLFVIDGYDISA
jgi:hypothetical protein